MSRMVDWFPEWVESHRARHPGAFLPDPASDDGREMFGTWLANLRHRGVMDRDVLDRASTLLVGEVVKHPRDHFPTLLTLALGIYKQRQSQATGTSANTSPIESARHESRHCPTCGGNGLVTVWRDPSGPVVDVILATQAAYCDDCPLGKLIEETHRLKAPDVRKRMSWRSTLLANGWLPHPPGLDDRHVAAHRHFTAAELVKAWTAPAPAPQPDNS